MSISSHGIQPLDWKNRPRCDELFPSLKSKDPSFYFKIKFSMLSAEGQ